MYLCIHYFLSVYYVRLGVFSLYKKKNNILFKNFRFIISFTGLDSMP